MHNLKTTFSLYPLLFQIFWKLVDKNINKDDIIFFNQDIAERNSQGNSYYTIKAIKDAEVQIEDLSYDKSQQTIQIEYVPEVGNKYGLIVNKDATINNYFAIGINRTTFGEYKESQLEFEEKYINNEPTWNDAKTFINIIGSLTAMWIGGMVPNGTATIAGGLFSFMTNLGDLFNLQVTPTIKDVINKLYHLTMDCYAKLCRYAKRLSMRTQEWFDSQSVILHHRVGE